MLKLRGAGLKWLKGFHLLAVSCWLGGGIALVLLYFLKKGVADGDVLYGINLSAHHVDMWVVVLPGAFGCLATGLIFSLFSNWGFFKHKWVLLKWIMTVVAIGFGSAYLGPWEEAMVEISGRLGLVALTDPEYLRVESVHIISSVIQLSSLAVLIFISIFKPWKSKKTRKIQKAPAA